MISVKAKFREFQFRRSLRTAAKKFRAVSEKAERLRMGKKNRREMIKELIRAAGYGSIRIKESDSNMRDDFRKILKPEVLTNAEDEEDRRAVADGGDPEANSLSRRKGEFLETVADRGSDRGEAPGDYEG